MFRKEILIDQTSYLELAGRKSGDRDLLALTMRGKGSAGQTTLASVALTRAEVEELQGQLADWVASLAG